MRNGDVNLIYFMQKKEQKIYSKYRLKMTQGKVKAMWSFRKTAMSHKYAGKGEVTKDGSVFLGLRSR